MKTLQPKIIITIELDQSEYLHDEDYTGIDLDRLKDLESLAAILDNGYYPATIKVQ